MSGAYDIVACDRCGASTDMTVLVGRWLYALDGGDAVNVRRCLGWCGQCKALRGVEHLDPALGVAEAEHCRLQIASLTQPAPVARPSLFWRMLGAKEQQASPEKTAEYVRFWESKLREVGRWMAMVRGRRSPPKCLECGGSRIVPFPAVVSAAAVTTATALPYDHPGCGGRFVRRPPEVRVEVAAGRRLYDLDGNQVSGEPPSESRGSPVHNEWRKSDRGRECFGIGSDEALARLCKGSQGRCRVWRCPLLADRVRAVRAKVAGFPSHTPRTRTGAALCSIVRAIERGGRLHHDRARQVHGRRGRTTWGILRLGRSLGDPGCPPVRRRESRSHVRTPT